MDPSTVIVSTAVVSVVGVVGFFLRNEYGRLSRLAEAHGDLEGRHRELAAEVRPPVQQFHSTVGELRQTAEKIRDDLHEIDKKLAVVISKMNRLNRGNGHETID